MLWYVGAGYHVKYMRCWVLEQTDKRGHIFINIFFMLSTDLYCIPYECTVWKSATEWLTLCCTTNDYRIPVVRARCLEGDCNNKTSSPAWQEGRQNASLVRDRNPWWGLGKRLGISSRKQSDRWRTHSCSAGCSWTCIIHDTQKTKHQQQQKNTQRVPLRIGYEKTQHMQMRSIKQTAVRTNQTTREAVHSH